MSQRSASSCTCCTHANAFPVQSLNLRHFNVNWELWKTQERKDDTVINLYQYYFLFYSGIKCLFEFCGIFRLLKSLLHLTYKIECMCLSKHVKDLYIFLQINIFITVMFPATVHSFVQWGQSFFVQDNDFTIYFQDSWINVEMRRE